MHSTSDFQFYHVPWVQRKHNQKCMLFVSNIKCLGNLVYFDTDKKYRVLSIFVQYFKHFL